MEKLGRCEYGLRECVLLRVRRLWWFWCVKQRQGSDTLERVVRVLVPDCCLTGGTRLDMEAVKEDLTDLDTGKTKVMNRKS